MEKSLKIDEINLEMPEYSFQLKLKTDILGVSLSSGNKDDELKVARRGFFTDYDNESLFVILQQLSNLFLNEWTLKEKKSVSHIRNCLIFINANKEASIHINCPTFIEIVSKKAIEKNDPVFKKDIADVRKMDFQGIELQSTCAVIYIFSVGWRRGLYFDFLPIDSEKEYTTGDLSTIFASLYSYLQFPEIHRLEPEIKNKIFEKGWFPFIRIIGNYFEKLYTSIKENLDTYDLELEIAESFNEESLIEMKDTWLKKDPYNKHQRLIDKGIERYLAGDYISTISILYPRIEGIMRYMCLGEKGKVTSKNLAQKITLEAKGKSIEYGLFLPDDFNEYLTKVYFQSFDLETGEVNLSRHSLAHGVADEESFSKIKAIQGILILDQISYYI